MGCTVLLALSSCGTDNKPDDFATPLMRDHALDAETPLDAQLVHWALETYRAETPKLISMRLMADVPMRIPECRGPKARADGYLHLLMDRAGGDGQSGWQRNVYVPCYRNADGSYRIARFPLPDRHGTGGEARPLFTATVTCMGHNCSACELADLLRPSMYCSCTRVGDPTGGASYCNMNIEIGLGALDAIAASIPADYAYMPV